MKCANCNSESLKGITLEGTFFCSFECEIVYIQKLEWKRDTDLHKVEL